MQPAAASAEHGWNDLREAVMKAVNVGVTAKIVKNYDSDADTAGHFF